MEPSPNEIQILNILKSEEKDSNSLLKQIKIIGLQFKTETYEPSDLLLDTLVQYFVSKKINVTARRAIASALENVKNKKTREKTTYILSSSIQSVTAKFVNKPDIEAGHHAIDLFMACLIYFKLGSLALKLELNDVLSFMEGYLEFLSDSQCGRNIITENIVQNDIASTFKCCISVIKKCFLSIPSSYELTAVLHKLVDRCKSVLIFDAYGWDCYNAAGMTWLIIWRTLYDKDNLIEKIADVLDNGQCDKTSRNELSKMPNVLSGLGYCNGVMAMLDSDTLVCNVGKFNRKCLLIHFVLPYIQSVEKGCESISSQVIVARCFMQWTLTMRNAAKETLPLFVKESLLKCNELHSTHNIMEELLNYSLDKLEHPTDAIRHHSNDMLNNLLHLGKNLGINGFAEHLVDSVLSQNWQKRSTFTALNGLLDHVEPVYIMQRKPDILYTLLKVTSQQSLAPYVSETYKRLAIWKPSQNAKNHSKELHVTQFMDPLLSVMCNTSSHHLRLLIDYCFTKLLKLFGKDCIAHVFSAFEEKFESLSLQCHGQNKDPAKTFMAFLACMKITTLNGFSKNIEDLSPEKKLFYESLISSALVHQDSEIRHLGFALLCEAVKPSSLVATSALTSLRFALPYNTSCQDPAFRQCLLSSIKKLLLQLKGNIVQLTKLTTKNIEINVENERNLLGIYISFITWLGKFSISQLYSSAPYPKRNTCISILNSVVNIFAGAEFEKELNLSEVFSVNSVNFLFDLLSDPYEDVKLSSYSLLSNQNLKIYISIVLNEDRLLEIVKTSLQRAYKCMKPEWCTDAAFHLKLCTVLMSDGSMSRKLSELHRICCKLLDLLDQSTSLAERKLFLASTTSPMYGILHCLKHLVKEINFRAMDLKDKQLWHDVITRTVTACFRVSKAVLSVVGSVSPEGHLPDVTSSTVEGVDGGSDDAWNELPDVLKTLVIDGNDLEKDERKTRALAQTVLVCCWRSAKESSLLLQEVTSCYVPLDSAKENHDAVLSWHQLLETGEHLRRQLMEARHRGAFEIAYSAFKAYCPRLWNIEHSELNTIPGKWLLNILTDIEDPDKSKDLCATRRSAGLPFFIQALLSGNKNSNEKKNLHNVMTKLLSMCNSTVTSGLIPKVHSLNILRGLVKDASLGEEILPYVSQCMQVSLTGFASSVWAVRNSSTLLFSSLVTRIFGVKRDKEDDLCLKNRLSANEFFSRLPELHSFLITQLEAICKSLDKGGYHALCPTMHPILILLSRIYPSTMQPASGISLKDFISLIMRCRGSAVLKSRVASATALASILIWNQRLYVLEHCCSNLQRDVDIVRGGSQQQDDEVFSSPQNRIHGGLLQISEILKSITSNDQLPNGDDLQTGLRIVSSTLCTVIPYLGTRHNGCLLTRSTVIELFVSTWEMRRQYPHNDHADRWTTLTDLVKDGCLKEIISENVSSSSCIPGYTFLIQSVTKCLLFSLRKRATELICLLEHVLSNGRSDVIQCFLENLSTEFDKMEESAFNVEDLRRFESVIVEFLLQNDCSSRITIMMYQMLTKVMTSYSVFNLLKKSMDLLENCNSSQSLFSQTLIEFQATCMKHLLTEELTSDFDELFGQWIQILSSSSRSFENTDDVRLAVANSLRMNAECVLLADERTLGAKSVLAWMIVINILCDEEADIRKVASDIVHIVWSKIKVDKGRPNVDMLSLRYAIASFLLTHGRSQTDECRHALQSLATTESDIVPVSIEISNHVGMEASQKLQDTGPGLFDRSATNTYLDAVAVSRVARAGLSLLKDLEEFPEKVLKPDIILKRLTENDIFEDL